MEDFRNVTLVLPANLVRDAEEFGLLTGEKVAQFLRTEIDQRVNPLVNEEIHAYRREKRNKSIASQ